METRCGSDGLSMQRLNRRLGSRKQRPIQDPYRIDDLEPRRMFTAILDIDNSGQLTYNEQASGIGNQLTVTSTGPAGVYDFTEDGIGSSVTLGTGAINAGWSINLGNILEGPTDTVTSITIALGDGSDDAAINSSEAPVNVVCAGGTTVELGTFTPTGTQGIKQSVRLITISGSPELDIFDDGDTASRNVAITDTSITGITPAPITFDQFPDLLVAGGTGTNTFTVNNSLSFNPRDEIILESKGQDVFDIKSLASGKHLAVSTSTGASDTVNVTNNGSVTKILGDVQLDAQFGGSFAVLNVDSAADSAPSQAVISTSFNNMMTPVGSISGLTGVPITFDPYGLHELDIHGGGGGNSFTINQSVGPVVDTLHPLTDAQFTAKIDAGSGDDTINVQATPRLSALNVNGQGGILHVNLGGPAADVGLGPGIHGTIDVSNAGSSTDLTADDSNDVAAKTVTLNSTSLTGVYVNASITFTDMKSLAVIGTPFPDTFDVSPSGLATFSIDGGPIPAGAGSADVLRVHPGGASGLSLALQTIATAQQGQYTFADRQPVSFLRMGTVSPLIGSISGHVFSGQSAAAIAGATLFLDTNQNGSPDPGEPTAMSDSSGSYLFAGLAPGAYRVAQSPPAGLIGTGAGFADVTVLAGQTISTNFADVAEPTASGPDLTVSFLNSPSLSVIGGSKGKLKLQITNSPAAAVAGSPVVELFASSTGALSAGQTPFATLPAGSLKLRPGASRTLNVSFNFPAGLPDGNYFLIASIDPTNVIAESNKANNLAVSASAVAIAAPFVDLTGAFGTPLPASIGKSHPATIPIAVKNIGNITGAGVMSVSLFASTDQTLDGGDQLLIKITGQRVNLKPGKSQLIHGKVKAPAGLAAGSHFLIAVVNSDHTLAETTTANDVVVSGSAISIG